MDDFKFDIGDRVQTALSGEPGQVIGRAQHQYGEDQYYLRLVRSDGRQVDEWFPVSAIVAEA